MEVRVIAHVENEVTRMKKIVVENVIRIANCLKQAENGWLWPTEISNRTGLHRKTVTRLLESHLANFIEEQRLDPSNIRMFKIKANVDMTAILKFISVKEKMDRVLGKR
jgi:hypothetical protein